MSGGNILGTYDLEKKVEDTLIVLDASMKNYGNANRAVNIESAILSLVSNKHASDPAGRFALVTYGETTEILMEFDDWSMDAFRDTMYDNINILGVKSFLMDGLTTGFQVLAKSMMRLFEGKNFRMIVVTEGTVDHRKGEPDFRTLVDKCEKIGLFIDVVEITDIAHKNILKTLASGTHGDLITCNERDVNSYITSLAAKKKKGSANQTDADNNMSAFLEIIAQPLDNMDRKITKPEELMGLVLGDTATTKCAICHSDTCMICKGPSYACGAYCKNCGRFFHEHCFAAWAESSKDTPPSIGKCPVCFALLKVAGAMYRVKVLQSHMKNKLEPYDKKFRASKINLGEFGKKGAYLTCSWCSNAYKPGEDIFECGNSNCNAYYHLDCFNEMIVKTKDRCRVCDTKQARRFDANPALQRIT